MSRSTAKRLKEAKEEFKYTRTSHPSKIAPYIEQIYEYYTSPHYKYNGTRIDNELKNSGIRVQ